MAIYLGVIKYNLYKVLNMQNYMCVLHMYKYSYTYIHIYIHILTVTVWNPMLLHFKCWTLLFLWSCYKKWSRPIGINQNTKKITWCYNNVLQYFMWNLAENKIVVWSMTFWFNNFESKEMLWGGIMIISFAERNKWI